MRLEWNSSCGRLYLALTPEQAQSCAHPGPCDEDVAALSTVPEVAAQVAAWPADDLREELRGYGAWDPEELADDAQNRQRMLWLAASDMAENQRREA